MLTLNSRNYTKQLASFEDRLVQLKASYQKLLDNSIHLVALLNRTYVEHEGYCITYCGIQTSGSQCHLRLEYGAHGSGITFSTKGLAHLNSGLASAEAAARVIATTEEEWIGRFLMRHKNNVAVVRTLLTAVLEGK